MSNPSLDSVWLNDEEYAKLLDYLLDFTVTSGQGSLDNLLRHANRHTYRKEFYELCEQLLETAKGLQPEHTDIWKVMKALAQCTQPSISAMGAYGACLFRPIDGGDRLVMVHEFLSELKDPLPPLKTPTDDPAADLAYERTLRYQGSLLAGIIHTGDEEAIELAKPAWQKLDDLTKLVFFEVPLDHMTFPYLHFVLGVIEGSADNDALRRAAVKQLAMPGNLEQPIIQSFTFNFGLADRRHNYVINPKDWSYFSDYAEHNAKVLREVGEEIGDPESIEHLLSEWAEWNSDQVDQELPDDYFPDGKKS
jgi:hypothetical protein